MKVLQVVADGRPGGGTSVALDLAAAVRQRGWASELCTDARSHAAAVAARAGDRVLELPWFETRRLLLLRRSVDRWLRDRAPDVVHLHGSRAAFVIAPLVDRHPTIRFHYTVHGLHFEHRSPPRRWLGRLAERRAVRRLRSRVFVCRYDLELARRRGLVASSSRCRVIVNGVDTEVLQPDPDRRGHGVVWLGRMVPQKDPLLVAEILAATAAEGVSSRMVGGGRLEDAVRRRLRGRTAGGRVTVAGSVPRAEALTALAEAETMILPSRWEGLPIAVLEAMALGVPVIAAPVGGVPEAIVHGESGWLVEERDPRRWTEELLALVEDSPLRERLARAARERVVEGFDWRACRDAYLDLWGDRHPRQG